jgi:translation initiation factor 2B subunit (eIF-2B alpha/beta/delta family)
MNDLEEWMRLKTEELKRLEENREPFLEMEQRMQTDTLETLRDTHDSNEAELNELHRQHEQMLKRLKDIEECVKCERTLINDTQQAQQKLIDQINEDTDNIREDYNEIQANKTTLEYEIHVYKRLLNSEVKLNEV